MSLSQRAFLAAGSVLSLFAFASIATAQNYASVPLGGRTATMGGAATAAGNDSAMPYLNPAGMAGIPGDILAISATVYGYTEADFSGMFVPGGTDPSLGTLVIDDESAKVESVFEIPTSVMYFKHLNRPTESIQNHLGLALIIPRAVDQDLIASIRGRFTGNGVTDISLAESYSNTYRERSYYFGPSYAVGIGDKLRLGLSVFGLLTESTSSENSVVGYEMASIPIRRAYTLNYETRTYNLAPVLGIQAMLAPHCWVGAGVATPNLWLGGTVHQTQNENDQMIQNGMNSVSVVSDWTVKGTAEIKTPWRLNVGFAYDDRAAGSAALDVSYHAKVDQAESLDYTVFSRQTRTYEVARTTMYRGTQETRTKAVLNVNVGGELPVSKLFSLRAGFGTDFSPYQPLGRTSDSRYRQRFDNYHASLGLGFLVGSFDSTVGVIGRYAKGEFGADNLLAAPGGPEVIPIDVTAQSIMVVLSGAVTTEEAQETIKKTLGIDYLPDIPGGESDATQPFTPPPFGPVDAVNDGYRPSNLPEPKDLDGYLPTVEPLAVPSLPEAPPPPPPPCMTTEIDAAVAALLNGAPAGARSLLEPAIGRCRPIASSTEVAKGLFYLGLARSGEFNQEPAKNAWTEAVTLDFNLEWDPRFDKPQPRKRFEQVRRSVRGETP